MKYIVKWQFFVDTKNKEKAEKVIGRLNLPLSNIKYEPSERFGNPKCIQFFVKAETEFESISWPEAIFYTINLGKDINHSWLIAFNEEEFEATSSHPRPCGLDLANYCLQEAKE